MEGGRVRCEYPITLGRPEGAGKRYEEKDFNRSIEIREREEKRAEIFMGRSTSDCASDRSWLPASPAHAGIDLALDAIGFAPMGLPRARGDRPGYFGGSCRRYRPPPRTRGSTP